MKYEDVLERAGDVSGTLSALGNTNRLVTVCHLLEGERSVGELADLVGISQSALSQHLSKMRHLNLVSSRQDQQKVFYRIKDERVGQILSEIIKLYGPGKG
jgi:DNA-binding transcriptional ArsR family regulator